MQNDMRNFRKALLIYLSLGLLLGGLWDIFWWLHLSKHAPVNFLSSLPLYFGLSIFCLTYALSFNEKHNIRLMVSSFFVAALLSLPFFIIQHFYIPAIRSLDLPDNDLRLLSCLLLTPILIYVGHSFHYAYHQDNTWKVSYSSLFAAVWDSFVLLTIAGAFAQISTFLIFLATVLFDSVGFNTLKIIYFNGYFNLVLHSILLFIGIAIAQQNHKMVHNLRFLLLRMMQFLFPLLAVISIVYFILYVVALVFPPGGEHFTPIPLLAVMILLGIVFFNACFQTGTDSINFPNWVLFWLNVYHVVLFCLTLELIHLCLTSAVLPLNVILLLMIGFLYTLSYASSVFLQSRQKAHWIRASNISIALFFLVSVLIINNPIHPLSVKIGWGMQPLKSLLQPVVFHH